MADGREKGGLDYIIEVSGNFEAKINRLTSLLKKLEVQGKCPLFTS